MTREQFEKLNNTPFLDKTLTPEEFCEFIVKELSLLNPKGDIYKKYQDTTEIFYLPLVSGYNTNRETFTVNIYQNVIEINEGNHRSYATCLRDCLPNKRAYPQETDYYFALLCKQNDTPICFTTFN